MLINNNAIKRRKKENYCKKENKLKRGSKFYTNSSFNQLPIIFGFITMATYCVDIVTTF